MRWLLALAALGGSVAPGCAPDPAGPTPVFTAAELAVWREMRDCRPSHEHELRFIRVFASEDAEEPYDRLSPEAPYPVGARLVKLEYDERGCLDDPIGYTAMEKLAPGASAAGGDWLWQDLDAARRVVDEGALFRCVDCHTHHCAPPFGYDLSCAEEL